MDPRELDRLIDETYQRLSQGKSLGSVGGEGPLASDHFLLNKSWEFFRRRLKAMEDQWNDIARSKEERIDSLTRDLEAARLRLADLEERTGDRDSIEAEVLRERTTELARFNRDAALLKERWEEERLRLAEQADRESFERKRAEAERDAERKRHQAREAENLAAIEQIRRSLADAMERAGRDRSELLDNLTRKEEQIVSLETKTGLLRTEVERRDAALREQSETLVEANRDRDELARALEQAAIRERALADQVEQLRLRLGILENERNDIRQSWQREQAEWRELWDRAREVWDRKKRAESEDDSR